jgi:hypothetical protein
MILYHYTINIPNLLFVNPLFLPYKKYFFLKIIIFTFL